MPLSVGAEAPDFTLPARPGAPLSLSEELREGPVVLLFVPLAFSSVCTRELCTVAEDHAAYEELGARVLAVSVDSPYVNAKFAEETGAAFPILSDFNKEVTRAYGVYRESLGELKGVSERAAFVIDRDGRIAYAWMDEDPGVFPPLHEVKQALRRLR